MTMKNLFSKMDLMVYAYLHTTKTKKFYLLLYQNLTINIILVLLTDFNYSKNASE